MNSPDRSLLPIFSSEQSEHVERIRALAGLLEDAPPGGNPPALDELFRRAHTLKGAARAVGLEQTELLIHRLEDVLARFREGQLPWDERLRQAVNRAMDASEDILAAALAGRPDPDISAAFRFLNELLGEDELPGEEIPPEKTQPPAPAPLAVPASVELVRVNADRLEDLIRASSQLLTTAALDAARGNSPGEQSRHVEEIADQWLRLRRNCAAFLRTQRDNPAAHPVVECLAFIDTRLAALRRETQSAAANRQSAVEDIHRLARELHQNACLIRMTPAEGVFAAFGPMVRDLAHQEGKQVEFRSEGLEFQADRVVLQALKDPVMHLLRNAVSHGVEPPAERTAAGKPSVATVRLRVQSRGGRLNVVVEDDGRGIGAAALRAQPGFSTAKMITTLSGRGLGLSIVQQTVNRLQGELEIRPGQNGGTAFSLSVPLSISTHHVLLIEVHGHTFGVPTAYIGRLHRARVADIRLIDGRESIVVDSEPFPLVRLSELVGLPPRPPDDSTESREGSTLQIVVLVAGSERAAVVVDRLIDEREAVIMDSGLSVSQAGLTAGAVPLDDGGLAVILNVNELFARFRDAGNTAATPFVSSQPQKNVARILVVDDSLTTRSLEKSILEAHGYHVQIAVDGLQALERLRAEPVDLVISDVMMPRLTGFELLEQMKSDKGLKNIPVILVTSLDSREEREKGLSLGADSYIVKGRFDQRELLNVVRQIL